MMVCLAILCATIRIWIFMASANILGATEGPSMMLMLREQSLVSVPWPSPDSSVTEGLEFSLSSVTLIVL